MATKAEIRSTFRLLQRLVDNQPSAADKIDDATDLLAEYAVDDWEKYVEVMEEEGLELVIGDVPRNASPVRLAEMLAEIGVQRDLDPTPDNIEAIYHAYQLRHRAFENSRSPGTNTGDVLSDTAVWYPHDLAKLTEMVQRAHDAKRRVSAVGSYRSPSNAPDVHSGKPSDPGKGDTIIVTSFLNAMLGIDAEAGTYRCEAGRTIRQINEDLLEAGLGFSNLGGGDFQTIVGIISTASHGSGKKLPDFSMMVQSAEFVTIEDGRAVVKKVTRGDPHFDAVIVSMGCMGVLYAVTMNVRKEFYLREQRLLMPWSQAKKLIHAYLDGSFKPRHFEVLVIPYKTQLNVNGKTTWQVAPGNELVEFPKEDLPSEGYLALATIRRMSDKSRVGNSNPRPKLMDVAQRGLGRQLARFGLDTMLGAPKTVPSRLVTALRNNVVNGYIDVSSKVLKLGLAVDATGAEYSVPAGRAIEATELILKRADDRYPDDQKDVPNLLTKPKVRRAFWRERAMHTSPISLRFVAKGTSLMSMNYGRVSCMIEAPMLTNPKVEDADKDTNKGKLYQAYARGRINLYREIFDQLDEAIRGPRGGHVVRPHWGQEDPVTAPAPRWVTQRFPKYREWFSAYKKYNASGTFSCAFTDRLNISIKPNS